MIDNFTRKLIEVSIPLDAINEASARENYIYRRNPSSIHKWWAQRPLAACRAVLFAQLVDDPSSHPEHFPTEEDQAIERRRLHRIIERLVPWEASNDETILEEARSEIRRSCGGHPPPILDPFAGGGSIPLEAQRLGLEAHASDLNPVAVLINKALIEIPPKFAGRPPTHLDAVDRTTWRGAEGLAEDVRMYGRWLRDEAERRIGHLYPVASLPDGRDANVIAWLWARTIVCPNPACGGTMPLVRSFWLGKGRGKEAWAHPTVEGKRVRFEVRNDPSGPVLDGTVGGKGAKCVICSSPVPLNHVRTEAVAGRMSSQLMAIVVKADRKRVYLSPTEQHEKAVELSEPDDAPDTMLPTQALGFRVQAYGMTRHKDLFSNRQLTVLTTLTSLIKELEIDAEGRQSTSSTEYSDAVRTYLGLAVSKYADYGCSLAVWYPKEDRPKNLFAMQTIPMVWDYPEINPFSDIGGAVARCCDLVADALDAVPASLPARVIQADAATLTEVGVATSTDPPYYDNIGYADLADFFYVWLRASLQPIYPELFSTMLTPKSEELVADAARHDGDSERAEGFFRSGFVSTFSQIRTSEISGFPLTVFYAFKQTEESGERQIASTGWEMMLEGLVAAQLQVTATWPMRTERKGRRRDISSNALASSIVLACRPRVGDAGVTDKRAFASALWSELPARVRLMQQAAVAPVDLAQAAIGPGMEVFSRYAKVIEPSGEPMRVRAALALINEVLAEVLDEQEGDFDADTRWAVKWFEQFGFDAGESGTADQLCRAYNTSIGGLVDAGIIRAVAGKTRLLERPELPANWDPATDNRVAVWEATQQLVKRLDEGGEDAAADLLRRLGGLADAAQLLAYRLYSICERKGWAKEAGPYNALGAAWADLQRISAEQASTATQSSTAGRAETMF